MRFGICVPPDEAEAALAGGFDYVELPAYRLAAGVPMPPGTAVEATNLFFDGSIRLFGAARTPYREVTERTVAAAAALGVRTMVVGSGGARRTEDAEGSDAAFVAIAAEIAAMGARFGVVIAPEALNSRETNVGNDTGALALALRAANVGWTLDTYHALVEWDLASRAEAIETMWTRAIPYAPTHVHLASLARSLPAHDDPLVRGAIERLLALGYDGRVSLEIERGDGFDFAVASRQVRALFD